MDVRLDVGLARVAVPTVVEQRQVVVDDHVDLQDVDPARDHVRRDEHFFLARAEPVDDRVTFRSFFRAVQRGDLVPLRRHALRDAVGSVAVLRNTESC